MIITIDGPAGAGKSTVAKELAKRLGFSYLDTGAMYRALTLKALKQKVNLHDEQALVDLAEGTTIDLLADEKQSLKVLLDGRDVTMAIRSVEVTNNTFYIARAPRVRQIMVDWQRRIGEKSNIVVEGRDAGTVIFPKADKKFYLDADFEERVKRRLKDLKTQGQSSNRSALQQELQERDTKDLTRSVGPLKKAEDAVVIDATHLSVEEVVESMLKILRQQRKKMGSHLF